MQLISNLQYSDDQLKAFDALRKWVTSGMRKPFKLGGFAGCGKTSILPEMRRIIGRKSAVVAYTNKAAKVLRDKGIQDAQTIFSLMYDLVHDDPMTWARRARLDFDVIFVDEASMIGKKIRQDLEAYGKPVVYIGDPFQLPPIGDDECNILENADFTLTQVHRQAKGSPIIDLATAVREGRPYPHHHDKYEITTEELREFDVIICYTNKSRYALNYRLIGGERAPRVGDKIIMAKTNYDWGLAAGEIGIVRENNWPILATDFGYPYDHNLVNWKMMLEGENPYDKKLGGRVCLDYGHAITCHKAQGSQFDRVLVWIEGRSNPRWVYTAVTRGITKAEVAG